MFENLKDVLSAVKNIDTGKIQWFHQLLTELQKLKLEKSKGSLNEQAQKLFEDPLISSVLPVIETMATSLKLDPVKSINIISNFYSEGKTIDQTIEELMTNGKK